MQNIGDRLKAWREAEKLNQDEAAARLGIPKSTYQKYETGLRAPGADAVAHFIREGINANWLISGQEQMQTQEALYTFEVCSGPDELKQPATVVPRINVNALAAIIEGAFKVAPTASPEALALHCAEVYQKCIDDGLITPDGVGVGETDQAA